MNEKLAETHTVNEREESCDTTSLKKNYVCLCSLESSPYAHLAKSLGKDMRAMKSRICLRLLTDIMGGQMTF